MEDKGIRGSTNEEVEALLYIESSRLEAGVTDVVKPAFKTRRPCSGSNK